MDRETAVPLIMLVIFVIALCVAGGASREDVLAQAVARAAAVVLIAGQLASGYFAWNSAFRASALFLAAAAGLVALQLIPLPPAWWSNLPGRAIIATGPAGANGWRPLNMVPDAGLNTLFSLLVPLCALTLMSALPRPALRFTPHLVVAAVTLSAVFALAQAAGVASDNGLINGATDSYAGIFANRNHQALFLAIGIVVSCHLGVEHGLDLRSGRLWLAASLILLFLMSILVTGSRTGVILAAVALGGGGLIIWRRSPQSGKAVLISLTALMTVTGLSYLLASYFGRAASIERATSLTLTSDFRLRSLSVVWKMATSYFPFGSGFGSFDAVFRMVEPDALLEPTYFNHAHDDFLEIMIEGGLAGLVLLVAGLIWSGRRMFVAFAAKGYQSSRARAGSVVLILIGIASFSDYPARTPMVMAVLVICSCWLAERTTDAAHQALRSSNAAL